VELASSSELSFMKFQTLDDVVDRYDKVCLDIDREAKAFFFHRVGVELHKAGIALSHLIFRESDTDPAGVLRLFVLDLSVTEERALRPIKREVPGFGPIKRVEVTCSSSVRRSVARCVQPLVESIHYFHRLFTDKYIDIHRRQKNDLVTGILPILLAAAGGEEEKVIIKNCRLSAPLRSPGPAFRFYIAESQLREMIETVASAKHTLALDPVIAMNSFLYHEEVDYFYTAYREGHTGFLRANFSETEVGSLNLSLQKIERMLNDGAPLSCTELCQNNNFSLQISTAPQYEKTIEAVYERCARDVETRFATNISNLTGQQSRISQKVRLQLIGHMEAQRRLGPRLVLKKGADMILDIIVKIING
jgi:hypothetical protein